MTVLLLQFCSHRMIVGDASPFGIIDRAVDWIRAPGIDLCGSSHSGRGLVKIVGHLKMVSYRAEVSNFCHHVVGKLALNPQAPLVDALVFVVRIQTADAVGCNSVRGGERIRQRDWLGNT